MAENKTDAQWLAETQDSLPLTRFKAGVIGEIALNRLEVETEILRMQRENKLKRLSEYALLEAQRTGHSTFEFEGTWLDVDIKLDTDSN